MMMNTNRNSGRFAAAIAAICLAAILGGCGGGAGSPDTSEPIISSKGATPASITVPATTSVTLNCAATSADGSVAKSILWSVEQAPQGATPVITSASTPSTSVTGMTVAGTYKFKLLVTGNNDVTKTDYVTVNAVLYANVSFVTLGSGAEIDFSASAPLPAGVTYILTDNHGHTWNSTSFDGKVKANDFYSLGASITFTQTFYLNGEEITGINSKRIVSIDTDPFTTPVIFGPAVSDSGSVTLEHP